MPTYLFELCNDDGSTPLGRCPEFEIEGADHLEARGKVLNAHPGHEVVSWGLKSDIEASRKWFGA